MPGMEGISLQQLPRRPGGAVVDLLANVSHAGCVVDCVLARGADGVWTLVQQKNVGAGTAWVLLCTFLVISMQCGFAVLEVGSCREAHRMTVLAKNVLDSCISGVVFWICSEFHSLSILRDATDGLKSQVLLALHWAYCANSVTICSGSMAERTHVAAYVCYCVVMAGLIYPIVAEAAWGLEPDALFWGQFHDRFHKGVVYHDFAGSGVVHLVGGCCAFIGNCFLGRRIVRSVSAPNTPAHSPCRPAYEQPAAESAAATQPGVASMVDLQLFEPEPILRPSGGWLRRFDDLERDAEEFRPCSYLQAMGMFMLWVGWYGFNSASVLAMRRFGATIAGIVVWNTTVAACAGGVGAYFFCVLFRKSLDVTTICNGVMSGLVSITASCDVASQFAALIIGFTAGLFIYPASSAGLKRINIDDPVDAIPVHLCCGLFGVLVVGICLPDCDVLARLTDSFAPGSGGLAAVRFCQKDHARLPQVAAQAWGALIELCWSGLIALTLWSLFFLAEVAQAREVEYLERAEGLLTSMTTGQSQPHCAEQWRRIMKASRAARKVLFRHGCTETGFADDSPRDLWKLRRELREKREEFESALELSLPDSACSKNCSFCLRFVWRPLLCTCYFLPVPRLRLTPAAEITGTGAADIDGGRLVRKLWKALHKLDRASRTKDKEKGDLEREIQELCVRVQAQGDILEIFSLEGSVGGRHSDGSGVWQPPLTRVVEEEDLVFENDVLRVPSGIPQLSEIMSSTGVSENGVGSTYSEISDTPPHSLLAQTPLRPTVGGSRNSRGLANDQMLDEVSRHLANATGQSSRTGSVGPAGPLATTIGQGIELALDSPTGTE